MHAIAFALLVAPGALESPPAAEPRKPLTTLQDAATVLDNFRDLYLKQIPPALLTDAQAIAVIPHTVKAGFVVGGRRGSGVVYVRGDDGTWGGPTFIKLTGVSAGFQVGVESADVVLVFRTRKALDRVLSGKGKLTLGADAAIAAGPLGREAGAGTDAKLEAEIYSYSRSRGLFAGVSLEGAVLAHDRRANLDYDFYPGPALTRAANEVKERLTTLAPPKSVPLPPPAIPKARGDGR
jgi:lipid-binding SYLF domain-containing protein